VPHLRLSQYKLQGVTKSKLIMSVAPKPFPPHMDMEALYVLVSRVRALSGLRVLQRPAASCGGLDNLLDLTHAAELCIWNEGYDSNSGLWDVQRARQCAATFSGDGKPKRQSKRCASLCGLEPRAAATKFCSSTLFGLCLRLPGELPSCPRLS
jgi:hypothetical protein